MDLQITLYDTARSFIEKAGKMLYARETINNLMLGVSERLLNDPSAFEDPFFATLTDENDEIVLAAVMTPPHNMILAGNHNSNIGISVLISSLQENQINIPGVIGPVHISESFMKTWKRMVKESGKIKMRQRVYEIRSVKMPPLPQGRFRVAFPEDNRIITKWLRAFTEEALDDETPPSSNKVQGFISDGRVFVWEKEGKPVSMAMKTRPIAHSITINGVYTPPEYRRQGFATALVANLSQHLLDSGYEFVNLFTDLGNPTSSVRFADSFPSLPPQKEVGVPLCFREALKPCCINFLDLA